MTQEEFLYFLEQPGQLTQKNLSELKLFCEAYPYLQAAQVLYAKNLKNTKDVLYQSFLKKVALYAADRNLLKQLLETKNTAPAQEKDPKATNTATGKIELGTYQLEENPADTTDDKDFKHQDLIDSFIKKNPRIKVSKKEADESLVVDAELQTVEVFTESLAKIYIKQKQYEKAIRIFEKLNLKYPEKSRYFANQIQFLDKIIKANK